MSYNKDGYAPDFEAHGARFMIRQLRAEDASELTRCYSDVYASLTFNDDNCPRGFYVKDELQMRAQIDFWLEAARARYFARYTIVYKPSGAAVGVIEIFNRGKLGAYEDAGILRLDICSAHETIGELEELLDLCYEYLMPAFGLKSMFIKADMVCAARRRALRRAGYTELKPGDALPFGDWLAADRETLDESYKERYWHSFLVRAKRNVNLRYADCFQFDLTPEIGDMLLQLVLDGKKRATSSAKIPIDIQAGRMPEPGDLNIITNGAGVPKCVIETKRVTVMQFNELTYDIVSREGEDDDLESWRQSHREFFSADAEIEGYKFTEDMPVVFEDFECVYQGREYEFVPEHDTALTDAARRTHKALEVLRAFAREAEQILGAPLVSAYMTGSAAFGSYAPEYSDLDFFMVSPRELTEADFSNFHQLRARYRALADGYYSVLEGEIIDCAALNARAASKAIYWGSTRDYLANEWTLNGFSLKCLHKKGMLIAGKDVRDTLPMPPRARMLEEARRMLKTARQYGVQGGANARAVDWLFLLAQTLYYINTGDVTDKARAAHWLYKRNPNASYAAAIQPALKMRSAPHLAETQTGIDFLRKVGLSIAQAADELERALIS